MQQGGGSGSDFFGSISMLREFWAEDPAWTNPGDGNDCTANIVDNGTLGLNAAPSSPTEPIYRASGIGGKPAWDFTPSNQCGFRVQTGSSGTEFTVFAVAQITTLSVQNTITDAGATTNNAFTSANSSNQWRAYNNTGAIQPIGGTADTDPHLIVVHFKSNDTTFYVDGVSVATDTSGTVAAATGLTIGCNYALSGGGVTGKIAYVGMCSGDLTADGDYSTWLADVLSYYGIS